MDLGALTSGLLIGLREGVEGALIVAIILAYLARTGNGRHFSKIWLGAGGAAGLSVGLGILLFLTVGGLKAPYEQIFEGTTMLVAAIAVTWMLFWMRRQAAGVKGELQGAVDRALTEGGAWGLSVLAFSAVIREGVETSLFMVATAQSVNTPTENGAPSLLTGAMVGIGIAVVIGWGFYKGTRRINLRTFFRLTGIGLVFIAAGLVAKAIHEFVEVGVLPFGTQPLFDLSGVLPDDAGVGQFLRALFGYVAAPEPATFIVWLLYVVVVLMLFLRPVAPRRPAQPSPVQGASS